MTGERNQYLAPPQLAEPSETTAGAMFSSIRTGRAVTRADLRTVTGLSRTAVTARVNSLLDLGILLEGDEVASTGGRRAGSLVFNTSAAVVLAVAVGRSRTQLAVMDLSGQPLATDTRDHEVGIAPDDLMPQIADRLRELLAPMSARVAGIGMSIPGAVDAERLVSLNAPVMRGWDDVPLKPYLADLCRGPMVLANDVSALTRSEFLDRVPPLREAIVVKASTGLGMGTIAGGQALASSRGVTGELGHTKVSAAEGMSCRCGASGCLEAVASGWALVSQLNERGGHAAHIRELVDQALAGDPLPRSLLLDSGRQVGAVLGVAVDLLNPRFVVLGGDMGAAFDLYSAGVREAIYGRAQPLATRDLRFAPAYHGDAAGLVGCSAAILDLILSPAYIDEQIKRRR